MFAPIRPRPIIPTCISGAPPARRVLRQCALDRRVQRASQGPRRTRYEPQALASCQTVVPVQPQFHTRRAASIGGNRRESGGAPPGFRNASGCRASRTVWGVDLPGAHGAPARERATEPGYGASAFALMRYGGTPFARSRERERWSGLRGSNPSNWLGKPGHYHYAKPARRTMLAHRALGLRPRPARLSQPLMNSSTSSRFRSISSGVTASRFNRSIGSVFDGRTLKCQSGNSAEMPSSAYVRPSV